MPRNPQINARTKLVQAVTMADRAHEAARNTREKLNKAMVAAVEAGLTRGEVARIVGVSITRVSQIPGMPPGPNARKTATEPTTVA